MTNNRRPQNRKSASKGTKTSAWKPERRIKDVGAPRKPKHRGRGWE